MRSPFFLWYFTLLGVALGFFGVVGLVTFYLSVFPPRGPSDGGETAVMVLGPVGALVGGLLGAFLGSELTIWMNERTRRGESRLPERSPSEATPPSSIGANSHAVPECRPILVGDTGVSIGALKPEDRVEVGRRLLNARCNGGWIDAGETVVVVGGDTRRVVVRRASEIEELEGSETPLPEGYEPETTPLRFPPARVERIDGTVSGLILGCVVAAVGCVVGITLDPTILTVPVAGVLAGWTLRYFVRFAGDAVGPREDHRSAANGIACTVLLGAVAGAVLGSKLGYGFLGLATGLSVGALAGGIVAWLGLLISAIA